MISKKGQALEGAVILFVVIAFLVLYQEGNFSQDKQKYALDSCLQSAANHQCSLFGHNMPGNRINDSDFTYDCCTTWGKSCVHYEPHNFLNEDISAYKQVEANTKP